MSRAIPFIVGVVLTALVAHAVHQRAIRADTGKVADAAIRPVETSARPPGLPDLHALGWRTVGGRIDRVGGRVVSSATYVRGTRTVTISRLSDTKGLGMVSGLDAKWGRLDVTWNQIGDQLRGHTVIDDHHVVLTGTPASAALKREMMRFAVRMGGRV
jgi:hypothetical protein